MKSTSGATTQWWDQTWKERGTVVFSVLGETEPPQKVTSFTWNDPRIAVPGACAMVFPPTAHRSLYLTMTLGITQPLSPDASHNDWEFSIYTQADNTWTKELLYDLITGWSEHPKWLSHGHFLPITFFHNSQGVLDCVSENLENQVSTVGEIRGMYLWPNLIDRTLFEVSTGNFFLMAITLVTQDEKKLANETTPPHLLLLLKRLGIGQICDPLRKSAFNHHGFDKAWGEIKRLSHGDAIRQLNAKEDGPSLYYRQ